MSRLVDPLQEMIQCWNQVTKAPLVTSWRIYSSLLGVKDTNLLPTVLLKIISEYAYTTTALFYRPPIPPWVISSPAFQTSIRFGGPAFGQRYYEGARRSRFALPSSANLVQRYYVEAIEWIDPVAVGSCFSLPSSAAPGARLARFHGAVNHFVTLSRDFDTRKMVNSLVDLVTWTELSEHYSRHYSHPSSADGPRLNQPTDINCFSVAVATAFLDTVDLYLDHDLKTTIDERYYDIADSRLEDCGVGDCSRQLHPIQCIIKIIYQSGAIDSNRNVLLYWIKLIKRSLFALGILTNDAQERIQHLWLIWCKTVLYAFGNIRKENEDDESWMYLLEESLFRS